MEGDDGQPPAGPEHPLGGVQRPRQFAELVVDGDAERLEDAGRRMQAARLGADQPGDEIGQLRGGLDAALAAFFDDGAGNGPGPPLLAVMKEDVGQLRLAGFVEEVGGARPVPLHAHVERPVAAEREAALGLVKLHRRHADVENDAVDTLEAGLRGDRVERAEAARHENEPALRRRRERSAGRHGIGIAIYGDHAVGGMGVEKGRRIAAGAEGAVDEDAAARNLQRLADFRQEHGHVTGQSASGAGRAVAATRHRSRAPGGLFCTRPPGREPKTFFRSRTFARASSRCVRKRSGSHIWNL